MNNLRKLKKKKPPTILNPEEMAQQKLFEISRYQDQQPKEEADIFLQTKFQEQMPLINPKLQRRTERSSCQLPLESKRPRIPSILSQNSMRKKSGEIKVKQPLPLTNYLIIDQRDKYLSQNRQSPLGFDYVNIMKNKPSLRKINVRSVPIAPRSFELKRQEDCQRLKSLRGSTVYAIQVKNIRLINKYPSFFQH